MFRFHRHISSLRWLAACATSSPSAVPLFVLGYKVQVKTQSQPKYDRITDVDAIWFNDNYLRYNVQCLNCSPSVIRSLLLHLRVKDCTISIIQNILCKFIDSLYKFQGFDEQIAIDAVTELVQRVEQSHSPDAARQLLTESLYRLPPVFIRKYLFKIVGMDAISREIRALGDDAVFLAAGLGLIGIVRSYLGLPVNGNTDNLPFCKEIILNKLSKHKSLPVHGALLHTVSYTGDVSMMKFLLSILNDDKLNILLNRNEVMLV